jgi:hypothetical protein
VEPAPARPLAARGPQPGRQLRRRPARMSVGCVGTMYEDTGPPWLAASGKRYSNGGLTFLAHLCRLELQHATAAPRWSGSTGADDASGPAGGMFSDNVAATVRSLELSFQCRSRRSSALERAFSHLDRSSARLFSAPNSECLLPEVRPASSPNFGQVFSPNLRERAPCLSPKFGQGGVHV